MRRVGIGAKAKSNDLEKLQKENEQLRAEAAALREENEQLRAADLEVEEQEETTGGKKKSASK